MRGGHAANEEDDHLVPAKMHLVKYAELGRVGWRRTARLVRRQVRRQMRRQVRSMLQR